MVKVSSREYYGTPAVITRILGHDDFLDWLRPDPVMLCQVVHGLIIHDGWLNRYEAKVRDEQWFKECLPTAQAMLDKVYQLDKRNPAIPRAPENRIIGCCRDFTTLLCAFLRYKKIPSRARCGFSTYLAYPGYYEDHWVCEVWINEEWVRMDAQVDPFQQSTIRMDGSPFKLLEEAFITAGEAWLMCRERGVDPMRFGISGDPKEYGLDSLFGQWFVRGNLLRDFAALNKVETVPYLIRLNRNHVWKKWRLVGLSDSELSEEDFRVLDEVAKLSLDPDTNLDKIRRLYNDNIDLQPPKSHLFS